MAEQQYKIRGLKTRDIIPMARILSKMQLKDKVKTLMLDTKEDVDQFDAGFNLFEEILANLHLAEKEIFDFLGGLAGISGEELAELDIDVFFDLMAQLKNSKGIANFLSRAVQ
jgi:hypothetical protein